MKFKTIIGWITASISFLILVLWTYWGINEAFHEGWFHTSFLKNLGLTFIQYLSIPIIFLVISLIALYYKRIGTVFYIILGIFSFFFFGSLAGSLLIFIPLILFALGYYFGEFKFKKIISYSFIGIFFIIILLFGIPQFIRVENRFNDNDFGERVVNNLTWAGQGDGFPLNGTNWYTAQRNCEELGLRLPTTNEIVYSLTRGNVNSGGYFNKKYEVQYKIKPDKETPLWNPHSQVIYYWTNETTDEERAYLVAYNGVILKRSMKFGPNYQGYRCVK
jgi:hypothetical protein